MSERGHERTDMNPKYVVYFGVGLVVVGLAMFVGIWWMFRQFKREQAGRQTPPALVTTPTPVPEPHLQISPQKDLEELRRKENEILSTYQWIDRDNGVARIPIDRAMQLFVERKKK
jgi:hypothetical protein